MSKKDSKNSPKKSKDTNSDESSSSNAETSSDKSITYLKLRDDSKTEIRYIYHMSDIHIRKLQRHDEYKEVFDRTYKILKSEITSNDSVIVLTGDIMHMKTEMSPEIIDITSNFFKTLNEIAPVILIPGNHDCNLSNKNRLDALSPIIENTYKFPDLFYLKKSGLYQFYNIVFGVTSVFEDDLVTADKITKENWNKIKQPNKFKIALYHGPVHNAKTDVGYRMNNEQLLAEDFKGYHYVMLGDIHRFQYMNENKTIAYSGSLIQQSYGESLHGHGILKWSLVEKSSELIEVRNDYGYCTVKIIDGQMIETKIPKKPRVRFILENTNQIQYQEVINNLEKQYLIQEIVKESNLKTKYNNASPGKKDKPTAYATQETMVNSYMEKRGLDEKTTKGIIELHKKIYQKILANNKDKVVDVMHNSTKTQKWRLLELRFSNALSYGKDNVIDFRNYDPNKIIGIFAPNHYGKSAVLDIILFCLFDKCSRGDRRDILNKNEKNMSCSILLSIGSQQYYIERIGVRNKNGLTVKIDVNFYSITTNEKGKETMTKLNGLDKNETNRKIAELIGDYNDYLTTCFSLQTKNSNFIDMTQLQKKEYLNDILKLNVFEECHNYAKDKLKDLTGQLKVLEQKIGQKSLDDFKSSVRKITEEMSVINSEIKWIGNNLLPQVDIVINKNPVVPRIYYNELLDYDLTDIKSIIKTQTNILKELSDKQNNDEIGNINIEITSKKQQLNEINTKFDEEKIKLETQLDELRTNKENLLKKLVKIPKTNSDEIETHKKTVQECEDRINIIDKVFEEHKNDELTDKMSRIDELKALISRLRKSLVVTNNNDYSHLDKLHEELVNVDIKYKQCIGNVLNPKKILNQQEKNHLLEIVKIKRYFTDNLVDNNGLLGDYDKGKSNSNDELIEKIMSKNNNIIDQENEWFEQADEYLKQDNSGIIDVDDIIKQRSKIQEQIRKILLNILNKKENKITESKINTAQTELDALAEFTGTKKEIDNLVQEKKLLRDKIVFLKEKICQNELAIQNQKSNDEIKKQINEIESKIDQITCIIKDNTNEINTLKQCISEKESIIKKHQKQIDQTNKLKHHYKLLDKYYLEYTNWNHKNSTREKWLKTRTEMNDKLNDLNKNLDKKQVELDMFKKEVEQYIKSRKEFDDKSTEVNLYQHYVQIMNCNGLPYEMLKTYLPLIESDVNEILHSMVNFNIEFMFYDDSKLEEQKTKQLKSNMGSVDINICYHNMKPYNVQLASGFERFIIGLAIRMTLCQISLTSKPNFLIIDEGWSCLDSDNLSNVGTIMNYIKTQYEHVIIISHLDELKSQADYIISIDKVKGYSRIIENKKAIKKVINKKSTKIIEL
ncbi:putative DNA repair protein [Acanthamoeba polyphaga mimivirus]|uniref:DNA repair protein n=1 Tax=Acanthamoeba polyphaga mimivirus Kroon TaxID=3069720 RepID=A0A0G2YB22_9VIRU|nr:putative DNA repair protein [Acanthamoeba polyphaga mimivirus]AKI80286.1 putative DNA repair protein [Acanthamoeba polyphaga mimivirus Kroon]